MKNTIELTIAGTDFKFNMTTEDCFDYNNGILPNDKVAPAQNLLTRTVDNKQKDELKALLDTSPASIGMIASTLITTFSPLVDIQVKK
ncbi:putative phage tail assembly chaperone [Shewanella surugensis]|uniref:Phage tail assembly chaperone n=1 Tax=Shewanella surugensis TaxID=212020 RepID=A0ABT0L752_9GAMM|nr:putative phage tail assembly chaperone [Shewanella surugensis]MCL1123524.1 putative phage tail assembly chaperone [Shewanella surugensis]